MSIMIPYLNGFEKRFCKKRYIGLQILEKLQGNNVNLNDSCMMSGFCNRKIEGGSAGNGECRPLQAVWKGERVKKETDEVRLFFDGYANSWGKKVLMRPWARITRISSGRI